MGLIGKDIFVCLDCETTGLTPETDHIIEVALVKFNFDQTIDSYETLIDPLLPINPESIAIHHITNEMVKGKPKIQEIIPKVIEFVGKSIIVGHGITNDIAFLCSEAKRHKIPCNLHAQPFIDTLRLARLYGESPINSLEKLRQHFNIAEEGAHRAMSDVIVNIEVFKYLSLRYKTTDELMHRLKSPIMLRAMPLGKHKGRPFSEIPVEYLRWAAHQNFDQDLLFSLKTELKKRKQGSHFSQAANPFSEL
jgi:DNA polymerase III subunit epsilon